MSTAQNPVREREAATPPAEEVVLQIVAVDDDQENLDAVQAALANYPVEILATTSPEKGLELIRARRPQIALVDLVMPGMSGMDLLGRILEIDPGIDVILMTGDYDTDSAVEAIKKGASDYLTKPIPIARLRERVDQVIAHVRERRHTLALDNELLAAFQFKGMVGRSPQMLELFRRIRQIAPHFRTALFTGDTGTGKELAAKALHSLCPVCAAPFVVCNCSAIVETLLESELFGYVKGAFTGAEHDRVGIFEFANGGTVMLDEIGDMPLAAQAKLLRVLQNQEIQRVGSPKIHKIDVRVIAATHRDLRDMVAKGTFREDLYYRLSMAEIKLPSLSDRKEDLALLERHFVQSFAQQYGKEICGLTRRAQTALRRYDWPGNIRELENVIGHAAMMTQANTIDLCDLPEQLQAQRASSILDTVFHEGVIPLDELDRRYARQIVDRFHNKAQAAGMLEISRTKLYRLLSEEPVVDHNEPAN